MIVLRLSWWRSCRANDTLLLIMGLLASAGIAVALLLNLGYLPVMVGLTALGWILAVLVSVRIVADFLS